MILASCLSMDSVSVPTKQTINKSYVYFCNNIQHLKSKNTHNGAEFLSELYCIIIIIHDCVRVHVAVVQGALHFILLGN